MVLFNFLTDTADRQNLDHFQRLERYVYSPLETSSHTRLLELLPAGENGLEIIRCKIHHVDLDQATNEYTAISYAWGDPSIEVQKWIECDGYKTLIPPTLYSTLTRLRHETWSQLFWADALSINQARSPDALTERSSQVRMMDIIFTRARNTIVDLGIDPSDDTLVVLGLSRYAVINNDLWSIDEDASRGKSKRSHWQDEDNGDNLFQQFELPELNDPFWPAVQRFVRRPWFGRLWIIQEFALAQYPLMFIGNDMIPADMLVEGLLRCLTHLNYLISRLCDKAGLRQLILSYFGLGPLTTRWRKHEEAYRLRSECFSGIMLLNQARLSLQLGQNSDVGSSNYDDMRIFCLLLRFRHFRVTDTRDRIYALLGIAKDKNATELYVDYTETFQQLSVRISRYMVAQDMGISLLHTCTGVNSDGPSWLITLQPPSEENLLDRLMLPNGVVARDIFKCCGNTLPDMEILEGGIHLRTRGLLLGPVLSQTNICPGTATDWYQKGASVLGSSFGEALRWMDEAELLARLMNVLSLAAEDFKMSCWRTMMADTAIEGVSCTRIGTNTVHFESLKEIVDMTQGSVLRSLQAAYQGWAGNAGMSGEMLCAMDRRLGLAYTGPCLLPETTKVGDQLAIFMGCPIPFVVRDAKDGTFRMVGSAYVHGFMDGQALDQRRFELQDIVLS